MAADDDAPQKKALILLADGSEDIEVAVPAYVFRLGGIKTRIASVEGKEFVSCYQNLNVKSDMSLEEAWKEGPYDVLFLPGGYSGGPNLAENELVGKVLKEQEANNGVIGAICYSPALSLTKHEIYKGKNITCYPDKVKDHILERKTHTYVAEEGIVQDGQLITAQGPAFAIGIALAIVTKVCGQEKANEVSSYMLLNDK